MNSIESVVRSVLEEQLFANDLPTERAYSIGLDEPVTSMLCIDSLDSVEIVIGIEDLLDVYIDDAFITQEKMGTIRQVIDLLISPIGVKHIPGYN